VKSLDKGGEVMKDFCKQQDKKKFFLRYPGHCPDEYLYDKEELQ
jgi:hypothetical protein